MISGFIERIKKYTCTGWLGSSVHMMYVVSAYFAIYHLIGFGPDTPNYIKIPLLFLALILCINYVPSESQIVLVNEKAPAFSLIMKTVVACTCMVLAQFIQFMNTDSSVWGLFIPAILIIAALASLPASIRVARETLVKQVFEE